MAPTIKAYTLTLTDAAHSLLGTDDPAWNAEREIRMLPDGTIVATLRGLGLLRDQASDYIGANPMREADNPAAAARTARAIVKRIDAACPEAPKSLAACPEDSDPEAIAVAFDAAARVGG